MRFLIFIFLLVLPGCISAAHKAQSANSQLHSAVGNVANDVGAARQKVSGAQATLNAVKNTPSLPPSVPPLLKTIGDYLSGIDQLLSKVLSKELPVITTEADGQQAADQQALKDAVSSEHQHYVLVSSICVGGGLGFITFLIVYNASSGSTMLLAAIAGLIVGGLGFGITGYVLAVILPIIKIILWVVLPAITIIGGWWIYNRAKVGNWLGALHTAFAPANTPVKAKKLIANGINWPSWSLIPQ